MRRMLLGAALFALACDDDSSAQPCTGPDCVPDVATGDAAPDGAAADVAHPMLDGAVDGPRAADGPAPDGPAPDGPAPDGAPPDVGEGDLAVGDAWPDVGDAYVEPDVDEPDMNDARVEVDAGDAAADGAIPDAAPPDAEVVVCPDDRLPEDERCDGEDNDCDGRTDEDFELAEACDGVGRCGLGFIECDDEGGVRCSTEPEGSTAQDRPERCNGDDDDCDGEADEAPELLATVCYGGPPGTEGVGTCAPGLRRCVDGRRLACAGDTTPAEDRCDGLDNDCDGETDEGYVAVMVCGEGVCRDGATPSACVDGAERPCAPAPAPGDDANCDGVDDDCDGATDEGYVADGACGEGRCGEAATPSRCVNGVELPCEPGAAAPNDPTCNGIDDDCDERIDEDYRVVASCGLGVCLDASQPSRCEGGEETPCAPGMPMADDAACDGIDTDCDGLADEDFVGDDACGVGVCALTPLPSRCQGGLEFECVPSFPTGGDDDCNEVDEDCDGQVDEHFAPEVACGAGICRARSTPGRCVAGVESACVPGAPNGEEDANCDLVDDDCDGVADEGVVVLVGGERRITDDAASSVRPRMVAGGGGYMLAWADTRTGDAEIYLRRLGVDGAPAAGLQQVSALRGSHFQPSLVAAGDGYGVAWHGTGEGLAIVYLARTDADGAVQGEALDVSGGVANAAHAEVVWNGQEYAVAWTDSRHGDSEVYLRRIDAAGAPIGAATRVTDVAGAASVPSLVHLGPGGGYAVAYTEQADGVFNGWFQRVGADGLPVGAAQRISTGPDNANGPRLVRDGDRYAVSWYDTRDDNTEIYLARVDANGARIGDNVRVTDDAHPSVLPSLVRTDTGFGVAWQDRRAGNQEIWFRHTDAQARPIGQPVRLSFDPDSSFGPTLAVSGADFAVAWYDTRHGEGEIYFARGPFGCPPE